jgi:hypothetical protein
LQLAFVNKLEVFLPEIAQRAPSTILDHNWDGHQIHPAAERDGRFSGRDLGNTRRLGAATENP